MCEWHPCSAFSKRWILLREPTITMPRFFKLVARSLPFKVVAEVAANLQGSTGVLTQIEGFLQKPTIDKLDLPPPTEEQKKAARRKHVRLGDDYDWIRLDALSFLLLQRHLMWARKHVIAFWRLLAALLRETHTCWERDIYLFASLVFALHCYEQFGTPRHIKTLICCSTQDFWIARTASSSISPVLWNLQRSHRVGRGGLWPIFTISG